MKTYQMIPPADGSRDNISVDGRTYMSLPGIAVPVPSFDVPTLQANGWLTFSASAGNGGAGETWAATFRRLAVKAEQNNPIVKPRLIGSVAWAASTAYVAGNVVSNGGKAYQCTTGGTSAAAGGPAGFGAAITDSTVTWAYIGPQTAPTVSPQSSPNNHNAALTNIYPSTPISPDGLMPFRFRGGVPTVNPSFGGYMGMVCTTTGGTGIGTFGNASFSLNTYYNSASVLFAGTKLEVGFISSQANWSIIVDGQYVDSIMLETAGGDRYYTIDFTNVVSSCGPIFAAGHQRHEVTIEWGWNMCLKQLACGPGDTISYPPLNDNFTVAFIGDSQVAGPLYSLGMVAQAYSVQMMHLLGWPDVCQCSIGGTGIVADGPAVHYGAHALSDLANLNAYRPVKAIFLQSSSNDGGVVPQIPAACAQLLGSLRTQFPSIPIFVTGTASGGIEPPAGISGIESAMFAGASQRQAAGDSLIFSIPCASDPNGPWIAGTGNTGAQNGTGNADFDICEDGVHLSQPIGGVNPGTGTNYFAKRMAGAFKKIIANIP